MKLVALAPVAAFLLLAGCSTPGSQSSQLDSDLGTIRSGYKECVDAVGADNPQCKGLADGVHSVAQQIGEAQNTAGRMKMEEQGRRSMGY